MQTVTTSVQKIQEVSVLLEIPNSRIIAGGTTFTPERKSGLHLVDISGLEGLDGIKQKGGRIEIGPLTTLETMAVSPWLKTHFPALAEAAGAVEDPDIRARGTLGGSLADPRIGDTAAALLASGAKLTIKTGSDFREIQIDRFWTPEGENDLQYDEWIFKVTLQMPKESCFGGAFGRIGAWSQSAEPAAAAAVWVSLNEKNAVSAVRGGLRMGKNKIRRMFPLEKALKNRPADEENIAGAVSAMTAAVKGDADEAALSGLLRDILRRACETAAERRTI